MAFACTVPGRPSVQQDDAALRITRWDFEPGAATGWHGHGRPYFVVMLTDALLRVHDGTGIFETPLVAGQSYRLPAEVEHDVMNGSGHGVAFVEIEVKDPAALARPPGG